MTDKVKVGEAVPQSFRSWLTNDRKHSHDWRDEAKTCYDFVAGRQWTTDEIEALKAKARPVVTFNRIGTVIDSVHGHEIGNRRQVRYIPREMGDVKANEMLTGAAEWFRDQSHADDEESDAFLDTLIAGMGWTETRIDFEESPEGTPVIDRIDPMEMFWDFDARQRNISDARRVWRVRKVPLTEAKPLFPNRSKDELDAVWVSSENAQNNDVGTEANDDDDDDDTMVTLVHCQWVERESYYIALDPITGEQVEFTETEYKTANKRMKMIIGTEMQGVRKRRKVRKQAFFGSVVLAYGDAPCPDKFSFQCITGKRDRNKGVFFGIVRAMLDPQRWGNKWLSQTMHVMNSNSKGGLMAERGAFENQADAEESWADPSAITWMEDGAIARGAVKEKTPVQFPAAFHQMTEFAISSIRDVTGVSVEMLGMREANQAASLEMQRRQAGMTILQPLFDSLKHYRELQGRVMLHYIQEDLSDGRLVKISGDGTEKYVPLIKSASATYDIIVDDAPNSPNQKEMAWSMMTQLMPMLGAQMPPQFIMKALEYSPLPSNIVEELQGMAEKMQEAQAPAQQAQQEIQKASAQAGIEKTKSETEENLSQAESERVKTDLDRAKLGMDMLEKLSVSIN